MFIYLNLSMANVKAFHSLVPRLLTFTAKTRHDIMETIYTKSRVNAFLYSFNLFMSKVSCYPILITSLPTTSHYINIEHLFQ